MSPGAVKRIETKIIRKHYGSISAAKRAINLAKITGINRTKLLSMIHTYYVKGEPSVNTTPLPPPNPPPTKFLVSKTSFEDELERMSWKLLILAVDHKLSRDEVFQALKDKMQMGLG